MIQTMDKREILKTIVGQETLVDIMHESAEEVASLSSALRF